MKLYYHHLHSPTVRKVRAVAFELGLALDEIGVDWPKGEHKQPWYLALNPNAKFPTLTDGDFVLWESSAICQYLAVTTPEQTLLPLDEKLRAEVTRWQCWEVAHFVPAAAQLLTQSLGIATVDAAQLDKARADFQRWAGVLDVSLRDRRFLVADRLSVADFCVASMLMFGARGRLPTAGLANLERWLGAVQQTTGWQRSEPPADH